mgnify:CR=1 FL=1
MHIVTTASFAPRRLPSISACPVRRVPRHAVGMADRDRAAVDVEAIVWKPQLVAAVDDLHREGLVQLPQVDVVDRSFPARASSFGTANTGPMPISSGSQPATAKPRNTPSGGKPFARGGSVAHHHARRGAVRELARVACRDDAARRSPGLIFGDALVGRIGADAFVGGDRDDPRRDPRRRPCRPRLMVIGHRHDLVVELAGAPPPRARCWLRAPYSSCRSREMP